MADNTEVLDSFQTRALYTYKNAEYIYIYILMYIYMYVCIWYVNIQILLSGATCPKLK